MSNKITLYAGGHLALVHCSQSGFIVDARDIHLLRLGELHWQIRPSGQVVARSEGLPQVRATDLLVRRGGPLDGDQRNLLRSNWCPGVGFDEDRGQWFATGPWPGRRYFYSQTAAVQAAQGGLS